MTWDKPAQVGDQEITGFDVIVYRNDKIRETHVLSSTDSDHLPAAPGTSADSPAGEWKRHRAHRRRCPAQR